MEIEVGAGLREKKTSTVINNITPTKNLLFTKRCLKSFAWLSHFIFLMVLEGLYYYPLHFIYPKLELQVLRDSIPCLILWSYFVEKSGFEPSNVALKVKVTSADQQNLNPVSPRRLMKKNAECQASAQISSIKDLWVTCRPKVWAAFEAMPLTVSLIKNEWKRDKITCGNLLWRVKKVLLLPVIYYLFGPCNWSYLEQ